MSRHARHILIGFLIVLTGAGILVYPYASQLWNNYRNVLITQSYSDFVATMSEKDLQRYWDEARAYNADHKVNTVMSVFDTDSDEAEVLSDLYTNLLNPNDDGVMGYIEIPKINLRLAIYHGLGSESLERGVGHVEGTSLPVGGESTHACIAGHRGLPTGELFTRLNELEENDIFYLYILDDVLAYQVEAINVVEPEDASLIEIKDGQDLVTLITCTPYSINTHRLLITGRRIATPDQEAIETTASIATFMSDANWRLIAVCAGLFFVFLVLVAMHLNDLSRKYKDKD